MDEIKILLAPENQLFIQENMGKDEASLILKSKNPHVRLLAQQILCRKKAKGKLPTFENHGQLLFPSALAVEQSSSEMAAYYKVKFFSGKKIADLTGGLGIDSLAFSSVFQEVFYCERDAKIAQFAAHNFEILGKKNIFCANTDGIEWLKNQEQKLDVIYLDPARRSESGKKVAFFEDCEPDVCQYLPLFFQKAETLVIKASPMLDIKSSIESLACVQEIHVISIENECKELLFLCKNTKNDNPKIYCSNISKNKTDIFEGDYLEESQTENEFSSPLTYLYEPNSAILKAGFFKLIAKKQHLHKLAQHTHLYTSENLFPNFEGRIFEVREFLPFDKKILQKKFPDKKANFLVRNYPISAQEVATKLNFNFGGENFIIATSWQKNNTFAKENLLNSLEKSLIFCKKIN